MAVQVIVAVLLLGVPPLTLLKVAAVRLAVAPAKTLPTLAVAVELAEVPSLSVMDTVTLYVPVRVYVWLPVTKNKPRPPLTVPELLPSPH